MDSDIKDNVYDDDTIMPFGKHKGEALQDVPDDYFLYLYDNAMISDSKLLRYVEHNLDAIKKNCRR